MQGRVISARNNLLEVDTIRGLLLCTIKGKRLRVSDSFANPLTAGDMVEVVSHELPVPTAGEGNGKELGHGVVVARLTRRSVLGRWSAKRRAPHAVAANADVALCVTSPDSPPFRPRFLDRLLIAAEDGRMLPVIVLNKCDLPIPDWVNERLEIYANLGYQVLRCSSLTGEGVEAVRARMARSLCTLAGQSGVGKSSLLNRLDSTLHLRVARISAKYNRGVHTTNHARLLRLSDGLEVIDTPGVREFIPWGIDPQELQHYYPEFTPHASHCAYLDCAHVEETGCAVKNALARRRIAEDRYRSYVDLLNDLRELPDPHRGQPYG